MPFITVSLNTVNESLNINSLSLSDGNKKNKGETKICIHNHDYSYRNICSLTSVISQRQFKGYIIKINFSPNTTFQI